MMDVCSSVSCSAGSASENACPIRSAAGLPSSSPAVEVANRNRPSQSSAKKLSAMLSSIAVASNGNSIGHSVVLPVNQIAPPLSMGKRFRRFWDRPSSCAKLRGFTRGVMTRTKRMKLRWREWKMILHGLTSTDHVILAHIIPTRRCNLACGYCNEYDDHSSPVPIEAMLRRLDLLANLGTSLITISGG